ncbi:4282_t:CDS:2 [Racocetra fulgida]|uniref:4282_t:CDS:1 n=1 Tax=Racocetra fulgida TaxID=60492 RepID=A0A9N8W9T7_9GLOM|nr:4282_t:CDS:2 [Racocetra fulgida]
MQIIIGGLQGNVALLVSIKDPEILDDAISAAKKIEARSFYRNVAVEKKGKSDNNWEEMKIGYNKLATLLTTQAEANNPRTRPPARVTTIVTCYKCSEKGYYAREYLIKREAPVSPERRPVQPSHTLRCEFEANYGYIDDDYGLEREVFAGKRYQLYQHVQSLTAYLSYVEELPTTPVEPETKNLEEKISEMDISKKLNDEQQKEAKGMLKKEKDIFAQTIEEFGCTN